MKAYKYRFESVLKSKKIIVDQLASKTARAQKILMLETGKLDDLKRLEGLCVENLSVQQTGWIYPGEIRRCHEYLRLLGEAIEPEIAGTGLEGSITLFGNSIALTKTWYIVGALLGGYPLAQGTVYLLLRRKTANILTALTLPFIVVVSLLVVLSPVHADLMDPTKPGGDVLGWEWLRSCTPVINLYAMFFLVGGAILSAKRFARQPATRHRAIGNALIATGAMMPAIGGSMAKAGIVEGLYVGEFVGLIFIWLGYAYCVRRPNERSQQARPGMVVPVSVEGDSTAARL